MNVLLIDGYSHLNMLPLTYTRPVAELRMGIFTFKERWLNYFPKASVSYVTEAYLSRLYPKKIAEENLYITASWLVSALEVEKVKSLQLGEVLVDSSGRFLAGKLTLSSFEEQSQLNRWENSQTLVETIVPSYPWDLFSHNARAIQMDFDWLKSNKKSQKIDASNQVEAEDNIFIEEGAKVKYSILNASTGPIYIGKKATIMEGCLIRGSFALCESATLKMGAKIYEGTTIGPHCKVGGEVSNSILIGYSNKGHDGFLGNSVIGEWCNLGADTNNSNLKNNYAEVKMWSYSEEKFLRTGLTFCGLIMGDHAKSAINTQFNTGTTVGVSANIFTDGFPPNKIDSFSWGGQRNAIKFNLEKAFEVAEKMMERRGKTLCDKEKDVLRYLFDKS